MKKLITILLSLGLVTSGYSQGMALMSKDSVDNLLINSILDIDSLVIALIIQPGVMQDSLGNSISNGEQIYTWTDLSGNNLHAVNTNNGLCPRWRASGGQNNQPYVSFDGADSLGLPQTNLLKHSEDVTLYTIINLGTASTSEAVYGYCNNSTTLTGGIRLRANNVPGVTSQAFQGGAVRNATVSVSPVANNVWMFVRCRFGAFTGTDAAVSAGQARATNTSVFRTVSGVDTSASTTAGSSTGTIIWGTGLNHRLGQSGVFFNGNMGDIFIFNAALDREEESAVFAYFISKYGILVSDIDKDSLVSSSYAHFNDNLVPSPAGIDSIVAWWSAKRASTMIDSVGNICTNNVGVAKWASMLENGDTLYQSTNGQRPVLKSFTRPTGSGKLAYTPGLFFDRSNDYLKLDSFDFDSQAFTVVGTAAFSSAFNSIETIVSIGDFDTGSGDRAFRLSGNVTAVTPTQRISVITFADGATTNSEYYINSTNTSLDRKSTSWRTFIYTSDGDTTQHFYNLFYDFTNAGAGTGVVRVTSGVDNGNVFASDGPIVVGGSWGDGAHTHDFGGIIYEVMIFKKELTRAEVERIWAYLSQTNYTVFRTDK